MRTPESSAATETLRLGTVSTVDAAANVLRELILDGQLEPGARLREAEFAERLGIARHSPAPRPSPDHRGPAPPRAEPPGVHARVRGDDLIDVAGCAPPEVEACGS
jgi:hypothetical protein